MIVWALIILSGQVKEDQGQTVVIGGVTQKIQHAWKEVVVFNIPFPPLFPPAEHLTARPDRPRPAPAFPLSDGQPRYQHSDPAGPALSSVQLRHHSGPIYQQADRVSRTSTFFFSFEQKE